MKWSAEQIRTASQLLGTDIIMTGRSTTDNAAVELDELAIFLGGSSATALILPDANKRTPASASSVEFLNLGAGQYRWNWHLSVSVDNAKVTMQVSNDNGSTWKTTGYDSNLFASFVASQFNSTLATALIMSDGVGNDTGEYSAGSMNTKDLDLTSINKVFWGNGGNSTSTTDFLTTNFSGIYETNTSAINAVRFIATSGNISGTIDMWEEGVVGGSGGETQELYAGVPLETIVIANDGDTPTFSGIAAYAGYDKLVIEYDARINEAVTNVAGMIIKVNADGTPGNYHQQVGGAANGTVQTSEASDNTIGYLATNNVSTADSQGTITIRNHESTSLNKFFYNVHADMRDASTMSSVILGTQWKNTAALASIEFDGGTSGNKGFATGSVFKLVGYKNVTIAASGGVTTPRSGQLTLSTNQTTDLGIGGIVKFDTEDAASDLDFDSGNFQFTLQAGVKVKLEACLFINFSAAGRLDYKWYDVTNAADLGIKALQYAMTRGSNESSQQIATAHLTPATDVIVELRLSSPTSVTNIDATYSYAYIQEIR